MVVAAVFPPSFPITVLVFIPTRVLDTHVHGGTIVTAWTIGLDSELHSETGLVYFPARGKAAGLDGSDIRIHSHRESRAEQR